MKTFYQWLVDVYDPNLGYDPDDPKKVNRPELDNWYRQVGKDELRTATKGVPYGSNWGWKGKVFIGDQDTAATHSSGGHLFGLNKGVYDKSYDPDEFKSTNGGAGRVLKQLDPNDIDTISKVFKYDAGTGSRGDDTYKIGKSRKFKDFVARYERIKKATANRSQTQPS
jgi:hypothetical protein